MSDKKTARIREFNDAFRGSLAGGHVVMTAGVDALSTELKAAIIAKVRTFNRFSTDNDPYSEHDFGSFEHADQTIFWKIDYYGTTLDCGSEDPSDPDQTTRLMTIMLASEY